MRELKFRAWDKKNKIMAFDVDEIFVNGSGTVYNMCHERHDTPNVQIEWSQANFLIMQYTGLKDKNGKDIYEGDIVKHRPTFPELEGKEHIGEIVIEISRGVCVGCIPIAFDPEIIGNIYENGDVLNIEGE